MRKKNIGGIWGGGKGGERRWEEETEGEKLFS